MAGSATRLVDRVHRQPELVAVWTLLALVALAILVTYARLPAGELYGVSGSGIAAGASRVVVFLGFPASLVAIATVPVAYDLATTQRRSPTVLAAALASVALCATIVVPGVLEESDLDAKWANAPAAAGVALALALTVAALRTDAPAAPPWRRLDTARTAAAAVLLFAALPWLAAELGFYLPGDVFETGQIRPFAGEGGAALGPAVHHGDHHGLSGVELALSAIALSRVVPRLRVRWRRVLTAAFLSLMLAYGLGNALQDFWLEQVVKRGWTDARIPSLLRIHVSPAWLAVVVGAALVFTAALLLARRPRGSETAIIPG